MCVCMSKQASTFSILDFFFLNLKVKEKKKSRTSNITHNNRKKEVREVFRRVRCRLSRCAVLCCAVLWLAPALWQLALEFRRPSARARVTACHTSQHRTSQHPHPHPSPAPAFTSHSTQHTYHTHTSHATCYVAGHASHVSPFAKLLLRLLFISLSIHIIHTYGYGHMGQYIYMMANGPARFASARQARFLVLVSVVS
jgi:hypothetical protein